MSGCELHRERMDRYSLRRRVFHIREEIIDN